MEAIFKIIAIGLITCFAVLIIKPVKADFALLVAVVGGVMIRTAKHVIRPIAIILNIASIIALQLRKS